MSRFSENFDRKVLVEYISNYVNFNKLELSTYLSILGRVDLDNLIIELSERKDPTAYIRRQIMLNEDSLLLAPKKDVCAMIMSMCLATCEMDFLWTKALKSDFKKEELKKVHSRILDYSSTLAVSDSPKITINRLVSVAKPFKLYDGSIAGITVKDLKERKIRYNKILPGFRMAWNLFGIEVLKNPLMYFDIKNFEVNTVAK